MGIWHLGDLLGKERRRQEHPQARAQQVGASTASSAEMSELRPTLGTPGMGAVNAGTE